MNSPSIIVCAERRTGIERRRYSYDSHIPDRRLTKQHRSGIGRRKGEWSDSCRRIDDHSPEN